MHSHTRKRSKNLWIAAKAVTISARTLGFVIFLTTMTAIQTVAQTSQATVRGTVQDASGAVIPGAQLTLTNTDTNVVKETVSSGNGEYLFVNVNPGTYTLESTKAGFTSQKLKPFALVVNQTTTLNLSLMAGATAETVEVEAVGAGVETASAELGLTLQSKQVEDIPLNTRNFTQLLLTSPGVSPTIPGGSQVTSYTTAVGPILIPSFNGQGVRSNLFVVDGVLDIETFGNAYAVQPSIDVIGDMKMQSHNDSAEFGGSTGATINISTKPGTNHFHGSLYEYYQTPGLQAVPYFTSRSVVSPQLQNQFGGTVGGPVIIPKLYNGRDKTFFFGGFERYQLNQPSFFTTRVLSPAELSGDFTQNRDAYGRTIDVYDPFTTQCNAAGVCTRQQISYQGVPNKIDPSRLNKGALYYATHALPAPGTGAPQITCVGCAYGGEPAPNLQRLNQYTGRIDENLTSKDSIFVRIMGLQGTQSSGRISLPSITSTTAYTIAGSYVHIFSPSSSMHLQAGKTYEKRGPFQQFKNAADLAANYGAPAGLTSGFPDFPTAVAAYNVDDYFSGQYTFGEPGTFADSWSVKGDYTQVVGKHTLKFGSNFDSIGELLNVEYADESFSANETNSLEDANLTTNPSEPVTTGDAAASFLLGVPYDFLRRNTGETIGFGGVLGIYGQDQYQITPNLTLNFGLRYEAAFVPTAGTSNNNNRFVGNFDFNNGTYVLLQVPGTCAVLKTAPCIPDPNGQLPNHVVVSQNGKVVQSQLAQFEPRFGLAYRIAPRTAIRTGFGVAYDNYAGLVQTVRNALGNWPSNSIIGQSNISAPTAANPTPQYSIGDLPALTSLPAATPFNQFNWFTDPNHKPSYSTQYNFGIQHEINAHTVANANYVGSLNRRLDVGGFYNVASTPGPGNPTSRQPYPYIAPTYWSRSVGSGSYNALQLQLSRTFSRGLSATVAYTWSKSLDVGCSGFFGTEGCSIQQIYNLHAEYGVSAFDTPQSFQATATYVLPIGRGKLINIPDRVVDILVGGWQVNGYLHLNSSYPFSASLDQDIANIGNTGYMRPNKLPISPYAGISAADAVHRGVSWLNPNAFQVPSQYTYGNMGRNVLRAPFYKSLDASVFKEFQFHNELGGRVALETFNAFNHPTFSGPNSDFSSSTFGQISGTSSNSRTIQLSAKVHF